MDFKNNVILYNDDCLNVIQLEEVKDKDIIIVTDPPFNIGYHYNEYSDKLDDDSYFDMLVKLFENRKFVIIHYPESVYNLSVRMHMVPNRVVSWVYNSNTPRQHRDIAYFGFSPDFNLVKQPYKNPEDKRIKERIAIGKDGCKMYDWIEVNQVKNVNKDKTEHPCQMPQDVMDSVVGIIPRKDIYIYDPFMGSGSTGIAAIRCGFKFIGSEIDKKYFDIAKYRIESEIKKQNQKLF